MNTTIDPKNPKCPACGAGAECATGINCDSKPVPGDWSVCYRCGSILRFNDDLSYRQANRDEIELLIADDPGIAVLLSDLSSALKSMREIK